MYKNWNDMTRLAYDSCARHIYDKQSASVGNYYSHTPGYRACETPEQYVEPLINLVHYQKVYRSGCRVDNESELQQAQLTDMGYKHQLFARPYIGAYMGAGQATLDRSQENKVHYGVGARVPKSCNLPGVSIDRFECLPEYGNPQRVQHVVEPWIRGGDNTRDHVRRVNYQAMLNHKRVSAQLN
jgi:hypothetical protein